jgi:hypothetical protein
MLRSNCKALKGRKHEIGTRDERGLKCNSFATEVHPLMTVLAPIIAEYFVISEVTKIKIKKT